MARTGRTRRGRPAATFDELGGRADGGLAILDKDNQPIHVTNPLVATSLRYFLARVHLHESGGLPERVAITSALRGEGVTFITRSIASVIAYDTDRSVVVIDLNWTAPSDTVEHPPGLADMVERGAVFDDVVIQTTNSRLALVPAGTVPFGRRPAVAGSDQLADSVSDIAKHFDHVLFDLPPVLASSEAMSASQLADAFVLVVRQAATAERQVEAALEEMRGGEPLGVVLNRFSSSIPRRLRRFVGT